MVAKYDVLIVGGGFSGTTLAATLLPRLPELSSIAILEPRAHLGRGVAYATASPQHLLNVPAGKMSCVEGDSDHFLRWLTLNFPDLAQSNAFLPRSLYGKYVEDTFHRAQAQRKTVRVTHLPYRVLAVRRNQDGFLLNCSEGLAVNGTCVVLAVGSAPPPSPAALKHLGLPLYAEYAWADTALSGIPQNGHVVLLGAGLTAVDQVLTLASSSFTGTVTMLSRRGILPATHNSCAARPRNWGAQIGTPLGSLVIELRRQLRIAQNSGESWHAVIDALRPYTPGLWQGLSLIERKRFLRHLRPFWEAARHRMPVEASIRLSSLLKEGRLRLVSGRLLQVHSYGHELEIQYRDRSTSQLRKLRADRLINCTGPAATERVKDPLTQDMLETGMARISPCGLGLEHDSKGQIVGCNMQPVQGLFSVGPPRKAMLWESTAVPEIRAQVRLLADSILAHIGDISIMHLRRSVRPATGQSDAIVGDSSTPSMRPELEQKFKHVQQLLARELATAAALENTCLTCSFQAEDVLLLDLVRELYPRIPVLFIDTGYHFAATYSYRDRLAADWDLNLHNLLPAASVAEQENVHGRLFQTAPDRCCGLRKVEPLFAAVAGYKVWLTGLRREQARSRTALEEAAYFTLPSGITVRKLSPFADWTTRDVWQLCTHRRLPLLPLYEQGYTSIGCEPCTGLSSDPNDPRSGRWAGKKVECGIHIQAAPK